MSRVQGDPRARPLANLRQGLGDRRCQLLALLFLVAETLDELTTSYAIDRRGLREGNPVFASLAAGHLLLVLTLKACIVVLVTLGALAGLHGALRLAVFRICVLIAAAVAVSNALAIARA